MVCWCCRERNAELLEHCHSRHWRVERCCVKSHRRETHGKKYNKYRIVISPAIYWIVLANAFGRRLQSATSHAIHTSFLNANCFPASQDPVVHFARCSLQGAGLWHKPMLEGSWRLAAGFKDFKVFRCLNHFWIFQKVSWTIFSDPRQGRMLRSQGWVPSTQPCNCCWGRSWDEVWLSPEPIRNPRFLPWQAAPPADIQGSPPLASQAYLFERMAPSRWCRSLIVAEARPFYV